MQNDKAKFKQDFIQRLIKLAVKGLHFTDVLRKNRNLWSIADQCVRSLTSIGANVVEAKSASSKKDYIHFFEIALKSANETKFRLIIIKEYAPEHKQEAQAILTEVTEISKIIASSVLTMKHKK